MTEPPGAQSISLFEFEFPQYVQVAVPVNGLITAFVRFVSWALSFYD